MLTRLLAVSVLVAVCSVGATAWLAAQTTAGAIKAQRSQELDDGNRIYMELLSYAATHSSWQSVGPLVDKLAAQTGRRVTLLTRRHAPIADSATEPRPLPKAPSTVVDPLSVDPVLAPSAPPDRISAQAVGPYRLPKPARKELRARAQRALACARKEDGTARIVVTPSGRPRIEGPVSVFVKRCASEFGLDTPTPPERVALDTLNSMVNSCLRHKGLAPVRLRLDMTWFRTSDPGPPAVVNGPTSACVETARRAQLKPYVASPALLFVTDSHDAPTAFRLSGGNLLGLVGVVASVLVLTVAVTVLAGRRLIRPLRALTAAAQRMAGGDTTARVSVTGKDELAGLAGAFNAMAESREAMQAQRKSLVSDIAHELRTPLSNIRGWLEAVQDGVHEPDPALVASLLEEATLLQRLIDDLQDLAQADAGRLRLHREEVSLAGIIDQVRTAHAERAAGVGVALTARADGELELYADPVRLRQAVDNLVTNAIRYTPVGGTVTVIGRRAGDDVLVEVTDTGTGIDAGDLPHVFDRFWRAEKSRSRATGGSGLGLAIVRHLAEAHGGGVMAVSTPGRGSTFTLRLPAPHRS